MLVGTLVSLAPSTSWCPDLSPSWAGSSAQCCSYLQGIVLETSNRADLCSWPIWARSITSRALCNKLISIVHPPLPPPSGCSSLTPQPHHGQYQRDTLCSFQRGIACGISLIGITWAEMGKQGFSALSIQSPPLSQSCSLNLLGMGAINNITSKINFWSTYPSLLTMLSLKPRDKQEEYLHEQARADALSGAKWGEKAELLIWLQGLIWSLDLLTFDLEQHLEEGKKRGREGGRDGVVGGERLDSQG